MLAVQIGGRLFGLVPAQQLVTDFKNSESYDMAGNSYTGRCPGSRAVRASQRPSSSLPRARRERPPPPPAADLTCIALVVQAPTDSQSVDCPRALRLQVSISPGR
jgi:hypothetical protein